MITHEGEFSRIFPRTLDLWPPNNDNQLASIDYQLTKGDSVTVVNPTTATYDAADVVRLLDELIAESQLGPGERLPPIRELASRFGVKAGTVRDALLAAQGKGLIKVLPRVGAIVMSAGAAQASQPVAKELSREFEDVLSQQDQNLFHALDTREALELNMVVRASERRELPELFKLRQILEEMAAAPVQDDSLTEPTTDFVDLDMQFHLEIGRLSGNTVMASLLEVLLQRLKPHLARIRWSGNRRAETNDSHARIYSALVEGDAEQAQHELRDHIRIAYNSLLDELRQPPAMNGGN
jgi:GntR family transcriptional repressor for pyruvate dehydrogenase complex